MKLFALLAAALSAACASAGQGTREANGIDRDAARLAHAWGPDVKRDVARVRAATAPFHSLDSAVAAGYAREVMRCIGGSGSGAMGFHHVNRAYVDSVLEVERPEILLYERTADGGYEFNGVEYIIPYSRWPRNAAAAPTVMGQPLERADDLNLWYLHVWVWKANPAGLFAPWNPHVHCPMS